MTALFIGLVYIGCTDYQLVETKPCKADTECETGRCLEGTCVAPVDSDGDGLPDEVELALGTDPMNLDTDGDGKDDLVEVGDPANPKDADGDGIIDALESWRNDADGDCINDALDPVDDTPEQVFLKAGCGTVGVCAAGGPVPVCREGALACDHSQVVGWEAVETTCDWLDNDCDGETDEGCEAPILADVTLSPDPAYEDDALTCTPGAAEDVNGEPITFHFAWTINGVTIDETGDTLDPSASQRFDEVVCIVTPADPTSMGEPVASNPVVIANSVPSLASVEVAPAEPAAGDTLTCTAAGFADGDGDADQTVYEWTVQGVPVGSGPTLAGGFRGGDEIECTATPFDGYDHGAPRSSAVTAVNTAPVLASVTLSPDSPIATDLVVCTPGPTEDADGTTTFSYTYAWTVGGALVAETSDTLDGTFFDKGDVIACSATPNDGGADGEAVWSSEVTVVNAPPTVVAVDRSPDEARTDDTLSVSVVTADVDGDPVTVTFQWFVDGVSAGDGETLDGSAFARGDTVWVVVTPNDGEADGAPFASESWVIANTAPVATGVTLTPTEAYQATTLTCSATATDEDGDAVDFGYTWTVNGAPIAATGETLTGSAFARGDVVACAATPHDGDASGAAMGSNTVRIANSAPVISAVALTPSPAREGDTLTCTPAATDVDGDAITFGYTWLVDGQEIAQATPFLSGAHFSRGQTVACRVTPTDGTTSGSAATSNAVTIENTAPVLSAVTLTPEAATRLTPLTCTPTATDVDGDAISYGYSWLVDGVEIGPATPLLTGEHFSRGQTVACRVMPTDGTGAGGAMTSNAVTIGNAAPVLSAVTLTPESATEASTLTCTPTATDADGDAVAFSITWFINDEVIAATSETLTGAVFSRGDHVHCEVALTDGETAGAPMASNVVTIGNTAPVVTAVVLEPESATETTTLTCTATATDIDGDAIFFVYAWLVDGVAIAEATPTLTGAHFNRGQSVACRVTPTDGTTAGSAATSNAVTIENTAPVLSAVTLTPADPTKGSTLTCTPTATDVDGDTLTFGYTWLVDGQEIAQATPFLSGAHFSRGQTVACRVTPNDGTAAGNTETSDSVTIGNSVPVVIAVTLSPANPTVSARLFCTPTASDADFDPVSFTVAWLVDGELIAHTGNTLEGAFSKNQTVACRATPSDGIATGSAATSNAVIIENTAPKVMAVVVAPSSPTTTTTLGCTASTVDADGDPVTVSYSWKVDGTTVPTTGQTLTGAYFSKGQSVVCTAVASDGIEEGEPKSSTPVVIRNTAPTAPLVTVLPGESMGGMRDLHCKVMTTSIDADGDVVTYEMSWMVDGMSYPGAFPGAYGPSSQSWLNDTVPAADTHLGREWTCTAIASDGEANSAPATSTIFVEACKGVPVGPVCDGETIRVAFLPGWGPGHDQHPALAWTTIEDDALDFGNCAIEITSLQPGFTLGTLAFYDVIVISNPSGAPIAYSIAEKAAIRAYLEDGIGGAYASFMFNYYGYDNADLLDLFGIREADVLDDANDVDAMTWVTDPLHPVAAGLPSEVELLGFRAEQENVAGWTPGDLLGCASFVMNSLTGSSVVVNDAVKWRSVYFTGMPEYQSAGPQGLRAIYNALLWAAGYQ